MPKIIFLVFVSRKALSENHFQIQGCQIFLVQIPKRGKYTKITTKYTIWPFNIRNGSKIDQIATKCCKTLQNLPKFGFLV
jgi:hypothetical protein